MDRTDPVEAFRAMDRAIAKVPFNCAVWANAGELIPQETKNVIREWKGLFRPFGLKDCFELNQMQPCPEAFNAEARAQYMLQSFFNHANELIHQEKENSLLQNGLNMIHDHAVSQLENIAAALHPSRLAPDIRIGKFGDLQRSYPHTDGGQHTYRFIQSIESLSTYLIHNNDAVPDPRKKSGACLASKPDIVFWEVPVNSVTLLTTDFHHCQAILHDIPQPAPGQKKTHRAIVVYDITDPKPV